MIFNDVEQGQRVKTRQARQDRLKACSADGQGRCSTYDMKLLAFLVSCFFTPLETTMTCFVVILPMPQPYPASHPLSHCGDPQGSYFGSAYDGESRLLDFDLQKPPHRAAHVIQLDSRYLFVLTYDTYLAPFLLSSPPHFLFFTPYPFSNSSSFHVTIFNIHHR